MLYQMSNGELLTFCFPCISQVQVDHEEQLQLVKTELASKVELVEQVKDSVYVIMMSCNSTYLFS